MIFSDDWKKEEDVLSEKLINDTLNIINFNKSISTQNTMCIQYISICDNYQTFRYMVFVPFIEYSKLHYENNFPYLFIKIFKFTASDDFMKWFFYTTRANKIPVVIGKIDDKLSGAWSVCHGDQRISWNIFDDVELITFDRWLYEQSSIDPEFKLYIKNPMLSKVPFPIPEQNFILSFNKFNK